MDKNNITPLSELLDSLRDIEGFPIGKDEDILALSDPPYYTACPNPYINDFIKEHGKPYDEKTDNYHREPFVGDVSEGKNDPIYNIHSYHTKVPPKAIEEYIKHYTTDGDIIFDGFCGTGMTGNAASKLNRKSILSDISPIASFIAYNLNNNIDFTAFINKINEIINETVEECSWLYQTQHHYPTDDNEGSGKINYVVWSDIFQCPYCGNEYIYWDLAVNFDNNEVKKEFHCKNCGALISKDQSPKVFKKIFDDIINKEIKQPKQAPVLISYIYNKKKYIKDPDHEDFSLISKIDEKAIPYWIPFSPMMNKFGKWGDTWRAGYHNGITHAHHFYTKRNIWVLSKIYNLISKITNRRLYNSVLFFFTSLYSRSHRMNRYMPNHNRHVGPLSGTLYVSSLQVEINIFQIAKDKLKRFSKIKNQIRTNAFVSLQSLTSLDQIISKNTIDYIFTDPPFGDNLMYSELNFILESWIKLYTNTVGEAIINESQQKKLEEYRQLMTESFIVCYKILKPKRWITVVFHNSKSSVWNAIQESLTKAGFIIANVNLLDKKKSTTKQLFYSGTVKGDLIISAYKPSNNFEERFLKSAGENLEIDFIHQFLDNLPKQPAIERTEKMLYSKMLAYYVQRGYEIRYNANSFYKMLRENFVEEDGYWFLGDQLEAYHEFKKKMKLEGLSEVQQGAMMLFITDEKSALLWLYNFLQEPKSFSDIYTAFTKLSEISGDRVPDLKELLENNFISEDGTYRLPKTDSEKNTVTEKRERELLSEFNTLLLEAKSSRKKLKDVRKEAIKHGFEVCYKTNRFEDILQLAKRLDRNIIESDGEISKFVEVAELKVEGF